MRSTQSGSARNASRMPAEAPSVTVGPPEPAPAYADMVRTLTRALSDLDSFHRHPSEPGDTERKNLREYQRVLRAARKALGMAE